MAKKIYCPACRRLVCWKEQRAGETTRYVCLRCGGNIWVKEGLAWKYGAKAAGEGRASQSG